MQTTLIVLWIVIYLYMQHQVNKTTLEKGYVLGYKDGVKALAEELKKAQKEKEIKND